MYGEMNNNKLALPLHYQQIIQAINIEPYLNYVENIFKTPLGEDSSDTDLDGDFSDLETPEERIADRSRFYNLSNVGDDRLWLQSLLLENNDSDDPEDVVTEEDLQEMLKLHLFKKKCQQQFLTAKNKNRCRYYSSGLLSNFDKYQTRTEKKNTQKSKATTVKHKHKNSDGDKKLTKRKTRSLSPTAKTLKLEKKKALLEAKTAQVVFMKRKKLWLHMSKKEMGKIHRMKNNNHKEILITCRRTAQSCMKHLRQKAIQSQKNMKENIWRAKRLTREMLTYWKRYDRNERETRKKQEKEAEEQRKMDVELMEVKRQQRKLNFLITQTELYAHFMSKKLGQSSAEEQLRILNQLDEEKIPRLMHIENYNSEVYKNKALQNTQKALDAQAKQSIEFNDPDLKINTPPPNEERPQPTIFQGSLKHYQLKGMNWLANLYDQGINGILADEMGLGKTVQSIAFLCHIAETYRVWGPFLIVSPSSTLHNWQQEIARFVPDFKVVPYWGNPQERKILRQFWDQKGLHTQEASFHVVITSYQLIVSDFKYFNRIKWQYLVLDEAQAIKSANSVRWKLLLTFRCRNRLLLTGTPVQNSMAELWALLHFIMPTMFDSHDEFTEWFSKDIESHAENKTGIDEKHLSRLHLILKPFMLRRIKKDVENELSDKIEILMYCPLTSRQKMLYSALRKKIRIEDLLHSAGSYHSSPNVTSNLMNLVMQFRKVCNHPELFERREARSPFFSRPIDYIVPKLIYFDNSSKYNFLSKQHLFANKFCIYNVEQVHHSCYPVDNGKSTNCSMFCFIRFLKMSPTELFEITNGGLYNRIIYVLIQQKMNSLIKEKNIWNKNSILWPFVENHIPELFKFITPILNTCTITHMTHTHHCMNETMEHKLRRIKQVNSDMNITMENIFVENSSLDHYKHRPPQIYKCHPTQLPSFLYFYSPKVTTKGRQLWVPGSRSAAYVWQRHESCDSAEGHNLIYNGHSSFNHNQWSCENIGGLNSLKPKNGWFHISIPDKQSLVTDCGKLKILDNLLTQLKRENHRVLIYSQMTRMIDILEEYMWYKKLRYMRLDGSSKISDRRDMVADFQNRSDIFVFLLSTRAGGLGINLTAADTVIFYDSDWNPTVDQQAMDRAHRLGQTKQVTVYRLITQHSIEERILQRAKEKSEIQRMVISGGNLKPDTLKPKEVVSLLLDDDEIESKYRQKQEERRLLEETRAEGFKEKDRKRKIDVKTDSSSKIKKTEEVSTIDELVLSPRSESSFAYEETGSETTIELDDSPIKLSPTTKRGRTIRRNISSLTPSSLVSGDDGSKNNNYCNKAIVTATKRGPGRPKYKTPVLTNSAFKNPLKKS
ncbi:Helicase superfamily 1/2, ATP-binding domain,Helicase, C-terminal,P-loop containing nucleoside [Cinara cedri]|uniref:Chromatin-remodeling ATPase INO80 n=1 Tax=Cinara cedri TaxID=506608 RepID=A0A5E4LXR9_9HEMI|nr:Helicase superfamily 1/2, ATP-binding domain,Helicase, C-terminal,P-loop containing nucleoside [Cinara cedri]